MILIDPKLIFVTTLLPEGTVIQAFGVCFAGSVGSATSVERERPETQVTERTGHMGNTFRFWAGGVDAVDGVFGDGGTSTVRGPSA
jgi:hypothetical protein